MLAAQSWPAAPPITWLEDRTSPLWERHDSVVALFGNASNRSNVVYGAAFHAESSQQMRTSSLSQVQRKEFKQREVETRLITRRQLHEDRQILVIPASYPSLGLVDPGVSPIRPRVVSQVSKSHVSIFDSILSALHWTARVQSMASLARQPDLKPCGGRCGICADTPGAADRATAHCRHSESYSAEGTHQVLCCPHLLPRLVLRNPYSSAVQATKLTNAELHPARP